MLMTDVTDTIRGVDDDDDDKEEEEEGRRRRRKGGGGGGGGGRSAATTTTTTVSLTSVRCLLAEVDTALLKQESSMVR